MEAKELRRQLRDLRRPDDMFFYEVVVARTFEDALMAVLLNPDIQTLRGPLQLSRSVRRRSFDCSMKSIHCSDMISRKSSLDADRTQPATWEVP